jgi:hypothetical protein
MKDDNEWNQSKETLGSYLRRMENKKLQKETKESKQIATALVISLAAFILMIVVQSIPPGQQYLNPLGMLFATIWLVSGLYGLMAWLLG